MNLFSSAVPDDRLHMMVQMLKRPEYRPELRVLEQWAEGFADRDGKFSFEFQTTFEPCMWELYLHACLKEFGYSMDFSHHAPDFVVDAPAKFCVEATVAAPAQGDPSPIGYDATQPPEDLNAFNAAVAIRLANSFSSKLTKYRNSYSKLAHASDRPFVIAIANYDRPFSHFAVNRPIMAALYGLHYDEEAALAEGPGATEIPQVPVGGAYKKNGSEVPLGLFLDGQCSEISAVIFSSLATWGKIRALADNPEAMSVYQTFHPNKDSIMPIVRARLKRDYKEHLVDGLHVFHNPFAEKPLDASVLAHERIAQYTIKDDELRITAPDDFLLLRMVQSILVQEENAITPEHAAQSSNDATGENLQ